MKGKDKEGHLLANDTPEAFGDGYTSGFIKAPDAEHGVMGQSAEKGYGNLTECYVSAAGHTRLFTATRYGKCYVLKCLKTDYLCTPVYRQALEKEFEIGLQLEHPNICRTFGMEHIEGLGPTIVMEYVDGLSLQTLIEEHRLSAELAIGIASQLMDAVAYMHSKQITHRDIKPANIMVTHRGRCVKLIDFGLSDSDLFNVLKMPAGTYRYIAPEQLLPGAVAEPRADIYSLGMVFEDMAVATGSKQLRRMAQTCAVRDAALRPDSIEALRQCLRKSLREARLVYCLAAFVAVLACTVAVSLFARSRHADMNESHTYQDTDSIAMPQNDNRVVDYRMWDR